MIIRTKINRRCIYIPKKYLNSLGIEDGDLLLIKCNKDGIVIAKSNTFKEIDSFFENLDEELASLWVKEKSKGLKRGV